MVGDGHGVVVVVDAVIGSPNTVAEGDNNNNCDREEGGCQLSRCFCSSMYISYKNWKFRGVQMSLSLTLLFKSIEN